MTSRGLLHHVEPWPPDLGRAERSWGRLPTALGAQPYRSWGHGRSWRLGEVHVVVERPPDPSADIHQRRRPGRDHLAF